MEVDFSENSEKKKNFNDQVSKFLDDIRAEKNENLKHINVENYSRLGKFDRSMLYMFGRMYDLVKENEIVDYAKFQNILTEMLSNKSNIEKTYIMGLFFPKTIKNATFLNPFPVPVYTYQQSFTFHVSPNESGNFVLQMVVPYMVEKSNTTASDVYYVNDDALDGYTVAALPVNLVEASRVPNGVFQAFVLVAASIDVEYVGREDISSGYFGASYHLSGTDVATFDNNVLNFNYIDNTINSVNGELYDGISINFFPQDSSFAEFKKPNTNSVNNYIAMSHRMNVYGRSLPKGTLSARSVMVNVTKVYATLPEPGFEDVMAANTRVNEIAISDRERIVNFMKESGLAARSGADNKYLKQFADLYAFEQNSIIDDFNKDPSKSRGDVISMIKNYNRPKISVKLPKESI